MKIFCIGRNYEDHIKELGNKSADDMVVFMKPDTAVLRNNETFYHPEWSNDIHFEAELVLKICKEGKHIDPKFSHKYYDEIGIGIDFTARDLQAKLKSNGLPWELSKSFNSSAVVGDFLSVANFENLGNIDFSLMLNNDLRQKGNSGFMIYNFDTIVSFISKYFTIRKGDLIYTGTPAGVGKVNSGDTLTGYIGSQQMLSTHII